MQDAAEWHTTLFLLAQIMLIYSLLTRITLTQRDHGRTNTMSCNEHSTYYINLSVTKRGNQNEEV